MHVAALFNWTYLIASAQIGISDPPALPWLRIIFALILCLAVAVSAILFIRNAKGRRMPVALFARSLRAGSEKQIEIVETRRASEQGQLCLFHYCDDAYLVLITQNGGTLLDKRSLPSEAAA